MVKLDAFRMWKSNIKISHDLSKLFDIPGQQNSKELILQIKWQPLKFDAKNFEPLEQTKRNILRSVVAEALVEIEQVQ